MGLTPLDSSNSRIWVSHFISALPELHRRDFAFDIELALALHQRGYSLRELPIQWSEQPGGHVRAKHALIMAMAVFGFGLRRWSGPKRKWTFRENGSANRHDARTAGPYHGHE